MKKSRDTYVVGGKRTPFVKSMGLYRGVSSSELMLAPLRALVESYNLKNKIIGDVGLGAIMNSSSNWNFTREVVLGSGLHPWTPGYNVQRACGTSLEATIQLALKISAGMIDDAIAGGVDSNSDLPIEVSLSLRDRLLELNQAKSSVDILKIMSKIRPSDFKPRTPAVVEPRTHLSMGQHCELMVKEWKVSQAAQDEIAFLSHKKAAKAYENNFYDDLVINIQNISKDALVRADTSLEKLSKLKPAFDKTPAGTLTAGNSTALTDGAACVLLASEESLQKNNWKALAKFVDGESAAVDFVGGDGLLMAPTLAVSRLLERNNLNLQDFDFYEIHEAFAGQVLCTLQAWESPEYCKKYLNRGAPMGKIDWQKLNINGGSIALGHPFAATGARIVASLAKMLSAKKNSRGLISICTAGGMGVAAIFESV